MPFCMQNMQLPVHDVHLRNPSLPKTYLTLMTAAADPQQGFLWPDSDLGCLHLSYQHSHSVVAAGASFLGQPYPDLQYQFWT